jgi:hypothetical protein
MCAGVAHFFTLREIAVKFGRTFAGNSALAVCDVSCYLGLCALLGVRRRCTIVTLCKVGVNLVRTLICNAAQFATRCVYATSG